MARWRWLRRWDDPELAAGLERASTLPLNFAPHERMVPARGWNLVHSHALIAFEPAGPPVEGGTFDRIWRAVELFEHSDPRIVVAHFRADEPVPDRRQLLDLQALGFHFLCPVRIGATRADSGAGRTSRALALETLQGHIERGREWFLLEKDHGSGAVRFHIRAAWRPGEFPALWSRIGFHLVGRRYQRAWHRLAHLRLRRVAAGLPLGEDLAGGIVHEGQPMPSEPVQFYAQRGIGRRRVDVEQEDEDMPRDRLWKAAGMGALAGLRSLAMPALLARSAEERGSLSKWLAGPLVFLAAGEMAADKLPSTPARTAPAALMARAAAGMVAGAAAARAGASRWAPVLIGATAAVGSTFASFHLRRLAGRHSRALGTAVALVEDSLAAGAGARLARASLRPTVAP